jgi:hypothetical protein
LKIKPSPINDSWNSFKAMPKIVVGKGPFSRDRRHYDEVWVDEWSFVAMMRYTSLADKLDKLE